MTRDDIIRLAREAKLPYEYDTGRVLHLKELERFAALVAAAERKNYEHTLALYDELRRLHVVNQELLEALIDLTGAGAEAWGEDRPCVRIGLAAIAKAEAA